MPKRLTYQDVKQKIDAKGDQLLSQTYYTTKDKLTIKCGKCQETYEQTFDHIRKGYMHNKIRCRCVQQDHQDNLSKDERQCATCKETIKDIQKIMSALFVGV